MASRGMVLKRKRIADLAPHPRNPRAISEEALAGLKASLSEFGYVEPVVWNERSGRVVGGHQRLKALAALGRKTIKVVVVDLDEERELALNITLNSRHIAGEWTRDLEGILAELEASMGATFGALRLDQLHLDLDALQDTSDAGDEDGADAVVGEPPLTPISIVGDLWTCGKHRLLCANATDADAVAALLDGAKPQLMVTDPPYGVEYDPTWRAAAGINKNKGKMGTVSNDDRADWSAAWAHFAGDVAYVWHAGLFASEVQDSLASTGLIVRAQIVWAKDKMALSRGDYHWQHEPCWYAVRDGKPGHRTEDRTQTTLWSIPAREDSGHGHGTQKPVECMARPMRNHGKRGWKVYDPFVGSGTSIIAAEREGRVCYAMDVDAGYIDVALARWLAFTGESPVRAADKVRYVDLIAT